MTRLGLVSCLVGGLLVATRTPGLVAPAKFREHVLAFPRSVLWGRILMGIAAVWAGIVVFHAASETLSDTLRETGKGGIWSLMPTLVAVGFPVAYWLVIQYGNQFLAMRGAAALTLLIAKQMVDAADASDLPLRLVVTTLAYVWVAIAMWLTIAPHHFRDLLGWFMASDCRCRSACSVGVGLGLIMVALGLFVY